MTTLQTTHPPGAADLPDPAQCAKCGGTGTIETRTGLAAIREVTCDGPNGDYDCDAGSIW